MQDNSSIPSSLNETQKTSKQISIIDTKEAIISELKFIATSVISPIAVSLILITPDFNKINFTYSNLTLIALSATLPLNALLKGLNEIKKEPENQENRVSQDTLKTFEEKNFKNDNISLSNHLKTILTMTPIAVSVSFILTLSYYNWALENNLGQAFTITSLQFSQDKYKIISATLMILFTLYLSVIPLLIVKPNFPWKHPSFLSTKNHWIEDLNKCTSMTLNIAGLTLLVGIPASLTFRFMQPADYAVNIQGFTTITFFMLQTRVLAPTLPNKYEIIRVLFTFKLSFKGALPILLAFMSIISLKFSLPSVAIRTGGFTVAADSNVINPMRAYSCIFTQKEPNKESIAFGIVADSKDTSVHIFSPEYNPKNKSYVHIGEDGKIFPNTPLESYIILKESYIIEQYDDSKHNYDWKTGKCTHK